MTPFLKHLGFNEETIKNLPNDIIQASRLYDGMQKLYVELPSEQKKKKAALAKGIAEGVRNLIIRINAVVNIPEQVAQNLQQATQQIPAAIRPTIERPKPTPPQPAPPKPARPKPTSSRPIPPTPPVSPIDIEPPFSIPPEPPIDIQPTPPTPPTPPEEIKPKKRGRKPKELTEQEKNVINKLKNITF